jgi:hypothetical protein
MRRSTLSILLVAAACGDAGAGSETGATGTASGPGGSSGAMPTTGGATTQVDASTSTGDEPGTSGGATTAVPEDSTTGEPEDPPPVCDPGTTSGGEDAPENYGYASEPPRMALADMFYTYDLRTNIGACATDRVAWTLVSAPAGAQLELPGVDTPLAPGETRIHEDGGAAREQAKVAWDLQDAAPGCGEFTVRWKAWRDCGIADDGAWGPELTLTWSVAVRDNLWYSGDMHVHTKHSERGEEAGAVWDYVQRMRNEVPNDAGQNFASRRVRSLRGRLHWLIFSEHTNNEMEECGRHFSQWCVADAPQEAATGRDVVREITEQLGGDVLLVVGSEVSNKFDGHFGFLPRNPFPDHPIYAPGYGEDATDYEYDVGHGPGTIRERWVDPAATNVEEIAQIRAMNALAIVNHETGPAFWVSFDWSTTDVDGLEVWNGGNRHDSYDDGAYHGGLDLNTVTEDDLLQVDIPERPIDRSWVGLLKTGRWPLALVGGSDVHDYNEVVCFDGPCDPTQAELATPTTSVWAPSFVWANGIDGVGDGLAAGRVAVHDRSNFIDLRLVHDGREYGIGDTVEEYEPGSPIELRAFGRVSEFVDGDNRVLLILGTRVDVTDPSVDVLYSSEDSQHFIKEMQGKDHMRYIRPDSSFDRAWMVELDDLGPNGAYVVWAQFVPWHNPIYLVGNGQDMALTGAIRIVAE